MFVRYLSVADVVGIHEAEVGAGVLNWNLLASAVEQPSQSAFGDEAYPTIHLKAAALLRGLVANHPFVKGNKRTALTSTAVFYGLNGYTLGHQDDLMDLILDVITQHLSVDVIAGYLESWAQELPDPEDDAPD